MANSTEDIVIRAFDSRKDLKEVQLLVGMGAMEQLALANRKAYSHPAAVSTWLIFAGTLIQALGLWPSGSGPNGWLGYLTPLPILACTALPILFGIDWLHRPQFEDLLKSNIKSFTKAIAILGTPKQRSNPLLALVMEYKKAPIGCILAQPIDSTAQNPTYRITHFHIDAPYRPTGVGNDLLSQTTKDLKASGGNMMAVTTSLTPYFAECLQKTGFTRDDNIIHTWNEGNLREGEVKVVNDEPNLHAKQVLFVDMQKSGWTLRRK